MIGENLHQSVVAVAIGVGVLTGLHYWISLNFLIAGHTKFVPEWCFGLLKQAFRRHAVSSLQELETNKW